MSDPDHQTDRDVDQTLERAHQLAHTITAECWQAFIRTPDNNEEPRHKVLRHLDQIIDTDPAAASDVLLLLALEVVDLRRKANGP